MAVQPGLDVVVHSSPSLDPVVLPSVDHIIREEPVDMDGGRMRGPPGQEDTGPKWAELDAKWKALTVLKAVAKLSLLVADFYIIVCSLHLLSIAFQLIGGKAAGDMFKDNNAVLLANPAAGCVTGVLAAAVFQSSAPPSSMVVGMVSAGLLSVGSAVPVVMGINVGATVTSYVVAGMQEAGDPHARGRVFADAALNAIFNWLTVAVLLPVECVTGSLETLSGLATRSFFSLRGEGGGGGVSAPELFNAVAKPLVDSIIQLDKGVIRDIATGDPEARNKSLIKVWCRTREETVLMNVTAPGLENCTAAVNCWQEGNLSWTQTNVTETIHLEKCAHLFTDVGLSDPAVGLLLLPALLPVLYGGFMVVGRTLGSVLEEGRAAAAVKKVLNTDLPFPFGWVQGYVAIVVGAGMTVLFQSSSVFSSAIMPLVGAGVISLERAYPLTLGSNIGSTATAILTALACPGETLAHALQIALCHFFFNAAGVLLWYPVPLARAPAVRLAGRLGDVAARHRWSPLLHVLLCFLVLPGAVFVLSRLMAAGWKVFVGVTALVTVLVAAFAVVVVVAMQSRCPRFLPCRELRNSHCCCHCGLCCAPFFFARQSGGECDAASSPSVEMQPVGGK